MKALDGEILPPEPRVVMQVKARDLTRYNAQPNPEIDEFVLWVNAKDVTPK